MARQAPIQLPRQRLAYSQKSKKWRKQNVDFADQHSFYNNDRVRQSLNNKLTNLNLYNGYVDVRDIQKVLNPFGMDASYVPQNIPHHPIIVPKVDLLVGEEINRRFEFTAVVTNPDAISTKEETKKQFLQSNMVELIKSGNGSEDDMEKKLKELERDLKTWQDDRELMANRILRHYEEEQQFVKKFNEGFKDALIMGEEIYQCDIESNEPILHKLNPLKVFSLRSGNSNKLEDSDLIIIEDHWSPGHIIDVFYDELKPKDIDYIMEYSTSSRGGSYTDDQNNHLFLRDDADSTNTVDPHLSIAEVNGHYFNTDYTDSEGNIRVLRVYWKSLKKMIDVKYYDELGDVQHKLVTEEYILDESLGEEGKSIWINECWEGTKIGREIYINMRPRKVQYSRLNNPSYGHFGIIGDVYNTNQGKAVSLVDRMKNYQYMYDILWDRTNKGIQKNYGKILELDLARIPDEWEVDKWMHFAVVNGIAVIDSFKEGNKGAATGKLAGNMQNSKGYLDMETGAYIQQHINLLEYIKLEMGEIAGISRQREGQVSNRETVGGVERSVNQSSHITEWWFMKHEDIKKRVLTAFLETSKIAFKGSNKKAQYILDDQSIEILNIDGDDFAELDWGIAITSSTKTKELQETMKGLAQAFMQNGGSFSTVMDIYLSPSLSDMRRKIERVEEDNHEREAAAQEQQAKAQDATLRAEQENTMADRDLKRYEIDTKAATEIQKAIIQSTDKALDRDVSDDGIQEFEDTTLDQEKLEIQKDKIKTDHLEKMKKLEQDWKIHKDKMEKEDKKIAKQSSTPSSK